MTYKLQDLIDMKPFQEMQDRLNEIYSFPSAIIDNDGNILTATAWQDICTQFHRKNKDCEKDCIKSDQYILNHLHEANPAVTYRCPRGLVDNATPIIIEGIHYGNFFTGQFFLEKPKVEFFREQAKQYGFDEAAYLAALKKVPIWTQEQLNSYLFFIKGLIAIISESGLRNIRAIETRKQVEESEKRYRTLFTQASEGIFILSADGELVEVNESFARMHGYSVELMHPMGLKDLDTPATLQLAPERIRRILAGETLTFEVEHYHKDGHVFPLEVCASLISLGGESYIQCLHRDISERKLAEEKIRQSEEFIRSILDTVDEGFVVIDRDYRILTANKTYRNQHSCNSGDVVGRHCYEISHRLNRPCYEEGEECAVRATFATGEPHTALHKHQDPDGKVLYVETKAFPIRDASGKITSVIETINNITEKHLLEEERLKTQKLESIGTLAGGIAHDFNNLLQGVFGYITMAKMTFDQKEKSLAMLGQAEKALHQSVNLTTQLLTFSKGGKPVKKPLSLKRVIENAVKFALSGSRTDFQLAIEPALWHVNGDEGQLGQVIQNIVLNADQAMPLGGVVKISARNVAAGDRAMPAALAKVNNVELVIEDNGSGIPKQYLDKIFDPYFTTKEKGSGLGLATSYSIIRNHDGEIRVASEVGKGTVFSLYLPTLTDSAAIKTAVHSAPLATPKARVLVMDDDELIRSLAREQLGELGNEVEVAVNGEEVLARYQEAAASQPFDLVILDLTVRGGMGGLETLRNLKEIDPGVQAVVSSGYSEDAAVANYLEHGFKAFLKKPYKIQELRNVIHSVLVREGNR